MVTKASAHTRSCDGTMHHHIAFEAVHSVGLFPTYSDDGPEQAMQVCTWGIHAMPLHSSADQLQNIKWSMSKFFDMAHKSPQFTGFDPSSGITNAIRKLTGMNSDHAKDQKKIISEWRHDKWMVYLGMQHCETMTNEACQYFNHGTIESLITKSESTQAWLDLTTNEQMAQFQACSLQRLCELGESAYQQLPTELR